MLLAASVAAVVFYRLKQPLILGYLLAGFFLGPNFSRYSPLHDIDNIQALSELGVIFLMFYIGLEFDIGKLRKVFAPSFLALFLQTIVMVLLGRGAGVLLGWSPMQSFFLGGLLSLSSSMVTVSFLKGRGELNRPCAHLTIGVLILEDILAILLLVILTGLAVNGRLMWGALGNATFLVGVFVVGVFVAGKLVARKALGFLHRVGNTEIITLFTVGLIFGVGLLAAGLKFALALGAFVAGAILSRTVLAEEIEKLTEPLRDVFSALFFVSMGMLIVPSDLMSSWHIILALSAFVMIGKLVSCWTGFVLAGQKAGVSLRAALPKTHIGEFSFVIAALGTSLQVTNSQLKAVASGVACASILVTPLLNSHANRIIRFCHTKCPREVKDFAQLYHNWFELLHFGVRKNVFLRMAFRPLLRVVINFFLFNAILVAGSFTLRNIPLLPSQWQAWDPWLHGGFLIILAALGIPFLVDILRNLDVIALLILDTVFNRPSFRRIFQGAFRELLNHILRFFIFLLFGFVFLLVSAPYLPSAIGFVLFLAASGILAIALWRRAIRLYSRMEGAVLKSMVDQSRAALTESMEEALERSTVHNPWPATLEEVSVAPRSRSVGLKIKDLDLRNRTGATIIAVSRGGVSVQESLPDIPLFPHDKLLLFGEKDQIDAAERYINNPGAHGREATSVAAHSMQKILVPRTSDFVGLPLREIRLPQNYGVTVLGIQRKDQKVIGPRAGEVIEAEDLLFVMGAPKPIQQLKEKFASS